MRFSTKLPFVATLAGATARTTSNAFADRRMFTSTYEYKTVPEGHGGLRTDRRSTKLSGRPIVGIEL